MITPRFFLLGGLGVLLLTAAASAQAPAPTKRVTRPEGRHEWQLSDESVKKSLNDQVPIRFVARSAGPAEWEKLPAFWNEGTETITDPRTGKPMTRKVVRIKVPLGISQAPVVPAENPLTVAKWALGKRLYFEKALSANGKQSCASCHNPEMGYTDQQPFSAGILGKVGGASAPTVINSAYHQLQFWDGRAQSLEDQAQGPVANPVEMFDGDGDAWEKAIARLQKMPEIVKQFEAVFGHGPTRDATAKAIASYERTVLAGNSIYDRAELAMRQRIEDEGGGKFESTAADYEKVLNDAIAKKDENALAALDLKLTDAAKVTDVAKSVFNGKLLFFNKARCATCHAGDNFTDNTFHNLGVGAVNGVLSPNALGRFASLPLGHKSEEYLGAFKTPTVRALLSTAPYMHDGSEKTLEAVIDFYDRGGNVNEFLDPKMRDLDAEKTYLASGGKGPLPEGAMVYNGKPVVPLKLKLTPTEKKDLVMFLKAVQSDPVDPIVADETKYPAK